MNNKKEVERHGEGEMSGVQFHTCDSGFPSNRAEQMASAHRPAEHSQHPNSMLVRLDRFKLKLTIF